MYKSTLQDPDFELGLSVLVKWGALSRLGREWNGRSENEAYARVYLVIEGSGVIEHHGRLIQMRPGSQYLIPPRSNLRSECRDRVTILWFHTMVQRADGIDLFDLVDCDYERIPDDFNRVRDDMERILSLRENPEPGARLALQGLTLAVLAPFLRPRCVEGDEIRRLRTRFIPVLEMIHDRLATPPTLDELAALAGYGRNHFARLFKQAFGVAPMQYYQRQRARKAEQLLRGEALKLEVVAGKLGFHDAFHFSRTFKKMTGLSPLEYRRQVRINHGP